MATTVTSDGVAVAYTDHGGNGPDLLLAHATGFCAGVWQPMLDPLRERYRVVSFDERGHGSSSHAPDGVYHWDGFATDALAVIDAVGLENPYGVGHSCGGALLLLAEMRRPGTFRAIWAYEPIVFPIDEPMTEPTENGNMLSAGARRRRAVFASRQEARENYASKPPLSWLDPRVLDGYVQCGLRDLPDGTVTLACEPEHEARTYEMGGTHGAYLRLAEVKCPVALVCGETTTSIGPSILPLLAARLDATTDVWKEHGHFGCLADPERMVASVISAFERS